MNNRRFRFSSDDKSLSFVIDFAAIFAPNAVLKRLFSPTFRARDMMADVSAVIFVFTEPFENSACTFFYVFFQYAHKLS